MAVTTYTYSISQDFPDGRINSEKLAQAINASSIITALISINTRGDVCDILFKAELSAEDKTTLDGNQIHPAGGLIASTDNTPSAPGIIPVEFENPQLVVNKPQSIGDRAWLFSHDLCDMTTWYGDAIRVVNENVGTGDGATTAFTVTHKPVIDLCHGKISDEDLIVPTASQGGSSFLAEVTVAGVKKTEREFGETTGGDYTIDYKNGVITFFVAPTNGAAIVVSYFYAVGSTIYMFPAAGKKITLTTVEMMFSADVVMNDTIEVGIFTYNPYMGAPPQKFVYPPSHSKYKTFWDLVAWSKGSFPEIPPLGAGERMPAQGIYQLRIEYPSPVVLLSSIGAEMRLWCTKHREFTGEVSQFTAYGISEDE